MSHEPTQLERAWHLAEATPRVSTVDALSDLNRRGKPRYRQLHGHRSPRPPYQSSTSVLGELRDLATLAAAYNAARERVRQCLGDRIHAHHEIAAGNPVTAYELSVLLGVTAHHVRLLGRAGDLQIVNGRVRAAEARAILASRGIPEIKPWKPDYIPATRRLRERPCHVRGLRRLGASEAQQRAVCGPRGYILRPAEARAAAAFAADMTLFDSLRSDGSPPAVAAARRVEAGLPNRRVRRHDVPREALMIVRIVSHACRTLEGVRCRRIPPYHKPRPPPNERPLDDHRHAKKKPLAKTAAPHLPRRRRPPRSRSSGCS